MNLSFVFMFFVEKSTCFAPGPIQLSAKASVAVDLNNVRLKIKDKTSNCFVNDIN